MNSNEIDFGQIGEQTTLIAQSGSVYLATNTPNTTLNDFLNYGVLIDASGRQLTDFLPIGVFQKDDLEWKAINLPYNAIFQTPSFKTVDALLGLAVGDAFGVPVEFLSREQVRNMNIQDMLGKDTYPRIKSRWGDLIPSGSWSDDTSMLIATIDSLNKNQGNINYEDIMNKFLRWVYKGEYSSLPFSFGIGTTILKALKRYKVGIPPLECGGKEIRDNGNGALMRILPFSLYCIKANLSEEETASLISQASSITHGHDISKMSCFIYTEFLKNIINTKNPILAFDKIIKIDYRNYFSEEAVQAHKQLLKGSFKFIEDNKINASGYVVDTLESVIYSILNTKNFEDAIKTAVNLGYDTDTTACITGSIAGILYGQKSIPMPWLEKLRRKSYLIKMSTKFDKTLNEIAKNKSKTKI